MALDRRAPDDPDAFWMPFTANRRFKQNPRMFVAPRDMHHTTAGGRQVLDGTAGPWCCYAGHCRPKITEAIQRQAAELDRAPTLQMGDPVAFELANRIIDIAPKGIEHVFCTNYGSESIGTASEIVIECHRARGEGARARLIARERGHHGVNFGGSSVGGIVNSRKVFGALLAGVDHLPHTHLPAPNAFTRGQPEHGAHLADDLQRIVAPRGAGTIAAVIVEPMAGSTGVPMPPEGQLERLRAITPEAWHPADFRRGHHRLRPARLTLRGPAPRCPARHDDRPQGPDHLIGLFRGCTCNGNPIAAACGIATLDTCREEGPFDRARELEPYWQEAVHSLRDHPLVIGIRNMGLIGAVELEPITGQPTRRAFGASLKACEKGILIRTAGDIIAMPPPLIISRARIDALIGTPGTVLRSPG